MKRLERLEESGARRLALELGTLALDRGEREARRAEVDFETADGAVKLAVGKQTGKILRSYTLLCGSEKSILRHLADGSAAKMSWYKYCSSTNLSSSSSFCPTHPWFLLRWWRAALTSANAAGFVSCSGRYDKEMHAITYG